MLQLDATQALGAALRPPFQDEPSGGIGPLTLLLILILIIVIVAVILWLLRRGGGEEVREVRAPMREAAPPPARVPPDAGMMERPVASAPEMEVPPVPRAGDMPDLGTLERPEVSVPDVEAPPVPRAGDMPDLGTLERPEVSVPDVEVPPATGVGETPKVAPLPMEEPRVAWPEEPESIAPAMGMEMEPPVDELAPPKMPPITAPAMDDLTVIEGIGPRIAALLQQNGINTFEHLAQADVARLRQILQEARLTALADPGTWPEQAALAAAGDWDQFEELTSRLRGGRRM